MCAIIIENTPDFPSIATGMEMMQEFLLVLGLAVVQGLPVARGSTVVVTGIF